MRLDPDAVVLVLGRAPPAQPGHDLAGVSQPLGQHDPHRVSRLDPQLLHRGQPAADQGGGHLTEVAADVVTTLQHRPGRLAAPVHPGQGVQDGRRANAQPQVPGHQAQQITGLQRGGPGQQPGQQFHLASLRARPLSGGDVAQRAHHIGDLQAGRPAAPPRHEQQLLRGLAQVTGLPDQGGDLRGVGAGRGGHRADGELLGQAQIHPGELRRYESLTQVTHRRQQLGRGLRQQRGQPFRQRQPAADLLQVTVSLGHDQVPHGRPLPP